MPKMNQTISIDMDILLEARMQKINISGLVNDYLKEYLSVRRENPVNDEEGVKNQLANLKAMVISKERELEGMRKKEERIHKGDIIIDLPRRKNEIKV